ncbi:MAG: glutamine--fructose-6-phosphate transaminase (isomerizing) [Patescibacteria group bacterium]
MCGIFAVVNDEKAVAARTTLEGLKKLEYRGYDSWGIAIKPTEGNRLMVEKHTGKIGDAVTSLPPSSIAIGHTRWATHGGVTDANAHPHLDCEGKIAVIHNGIVENYQEIKENLVGLGHKFISETDTEVIAHLIEENKKEGSFADAVMKTFDAIVGSNAIVVLDVETETIVSCRNGSPLVVGIDEENRRYYLGSDVPAFLRYTNKVYFLEDMEGVLISKNKIGIYDLKTKSEKKFSPQVLDWKLEDAEKEGFPHFLLKEIHEQTKIIPKTASVNKTEIETVSKLINEGRKVVFMGCGTASYCAMLGKYFLSSTGIESQAYGAYEFMPFSRFIDKKTVVIAISQSGETADTLLAVKEAKKNNAYIVSVVNARGSTMERLSDIVIPVGAGPEIAVVSTKAFTAQAATLYLLSKAVAGEYETACKNVKKLGRELESFINGESNSRIVSTAKGLMTAEHAYVIGKHLNFPGALEFALKLKESSYLHSEAFTAGELKHGVITLIQRGTPCFVLSSNDQVRQEVLSSAAELKARGGYIIGIAPHQAKEFDEIIATPDLGELTVFVNIVAGQLLGYYLGIGRGADPDKPRNLAKSVTVK